MATRLVKGFPRLPYEEQLRRLGRHSLNRCLRADLIGVYKMFSGGLDLDPSPFFIPPVWPGLRGHPFNVLQGPTVTTPCANSFKHQLDSAWEELFAGVPQFSFALYSSSLPHPQLRNLRYIIPTYAIPTSNSLSFIIVLTLKLFCIVLPYLYVVTEALCGPLYH